MVCYVMLWYVKECDKNGVPQWLNQSPKSNENRIVKPESKSNKKNFFNESLQPRHLNILQ